MSVLITAARGMLLKHQSHLSFLSENLPTAPCNSEEKLKCPPGPLMPCDLTSLHLCHLPSLLHPGPPPGTRLWPPQDTRRGPFSPGRALPQTLCGSFSLLPPIPISHLCGDLPWLPHWKFQPIPSDPHDCFFLKPIALFIILYSSIFYPTHSLSLQQKFCSLRAWTVSVLFTTFLQLCRTIPDTQDSINICWVNHINEFQGWIFITFPTIM